MKNKSDLKVKLTRKFSYLTSQDIESSLNILIEAITQSLQKKQRVEIRGFGSFSVRNRSSRMARNPKTGEAVSIPSKFHPYFRPSKALKNGLNK